VRVAVNINYWWIPYVSNYERAVNINYWWIPYV
jgi:hypothetical protein